MNVMRSQAQPGQIHIYLSEAEAREIRDPKSDLYKALRKRLKRVMK